MKSSTKMMDSGRKCDFRQHFYRIRLQLQCLRPDLSPRSNRAADFNIISAAINTDNVTTLKQLSFLYV
jgi:hypothetical protein